jgi:hypothetical protein
MKSTFLKAFGIVVALLTLRFLVDFFNLDMLPEITLIGSVVAGTLFLIAIVMSGVVSDFKESERIADDLPTTIANLFTYTRYIKADDNGIVTGMLSHTKALLSKINSNLKRNEWNRESIHSEVYKIIEYINLLSEKNVDVAAINALHTEVMNIMRMLNRAETIMKTKFIPAAYTACYIAIGVSMVLLLFAKIGSYYEALIMVGGVSFVLIIVMLLTRDMENPFKVAKNTIANVDLSHLFDLEEHLEKIGTTLPLSGSIDS